MFLIPAHYFINIISKCLEILTLRSKELESPNLIDGSVSMCWSLTTGKKAWQGKSKIDFWKSVKLTSKRSEARQETCLQRDVGGKSPVSQVMESSKGDKENGGSSEHRALHQIGMKTHYCCCVYEKDGTKQRSGVICARRQTGDDNVCDASEASDDSRAVLCYSNADICF